MTLSPHKMALIIPQEPLDWQQQLKQLVTSTAELCKLLQLSPDDLPLDIDPNFPLQVPRQYIAKIKPADPHDPLLLQVLPQLAETMLTPGYEYDPLQEQTATKIPGLLHKYTSRVLLTLTGYCAIHCRYCFRRHFPYQDNQPDALQRQQILSYIGSDQAINEVIFSGGDPLALPNNTLAWWLKELAKIPHLKRVRFHSRLAAVIPQRLDADLLELFAGSPLQTVIVFHINHPNEIDHQLVAFANSAIRSGCTLLNQSVLLKHINDNASTLAQLSEKLFTANIVPYYIHLLDKVSGTAHFDMDLQRAQSLYQELQSCLPGYLVPRLVQEIAGEPHKTLIQRKLPFP